MESLRREESFVVDDIPSIIKRLSTEEPFPQELFCNVCRLLRKEPAVVVRKLAKDESLVVVGDLHGSWTDFMMIMKLIGLPPKQNVVFVGDFSDRGPKSIECVCLAFCLKIAYPEKVDLLRGNHETKAVAMDYGFLETLSTKPMQRAWLSAICTLPLALFVPKRCIVVHGGLWRRRKKRREKDMDEWLIGSLQDLEGQEQRQETPTIDSCVDDILWSDPCVSSVPLKRNKQRKAGCCFNEEATRAFLERENAKVLIRGHEGPDARRKRKNMDSMMKGWAVDHQWEDGSPACCTVFSSSSYPKEEGGFFDNTAALLIVENGGHIVPHEWKVR